MRRGVEKALFLISFVFLIGFVSASIDVDNVSVESFYSPLENLKGTFILEIEDESPDIVFSSSLGDDISLRDWLFEEDLELSCESFGCVDDYSSSNPQSSKSLGLGSGEELISFYIEGENIQLNSLSFNVSSTFSSGDVIPLEIEFFDGNVWRFSESTGDYSRGKTYGCYDSSATKEDRAIGGTKYCERVELPESTSYEVGGDISGTDTSDLRAEIYDSSLVQLGTCTFSSPNSSCVIDGDFEEGEYYACIVSDDISSTNYNIKSESSGETCGFFGNDFSNSVIDYAIYAAAPKYASSSSIEIDENSFTNAISSGNSFLEKRFDRDCSDGCSLPLKISGISQTVTVSGISLKYSDSSGIIEEDRIYDATSIPLEIDFVGTLDLENSGFRVGSSGNDTFELELDGEEIIDVEIEVLPAPSLENLYPLNPPAGVPVPFTVEVDSEENISFYIWNFGDGTSETTTENSVVHTYANISYYELEVAVVDELGFEASRNFTIVSGSPAEVVNVTLGIKRKNLNEAVKSLNTFPSWYKESLKELARTDFYLDEINRLEKEKLNAISDQDYLEIALELYDLNVPIDIAVSERIEQPLIVEHGKIDPSVINQITKESVDATRYNKAVAEWSRVSADNSLVIEKLAILSDNGNILEKPWVYTIDIKSKSNALSYFVIEKSEEVLTFKVEPSKLKKYAAATAFEVGASEGLSVSVYSSEGEAIMYHSTKLGSLTVAEDVGICNFNNVCQKELGENYENCRSDCKPITRTIWYIVLLLFFIIILYTLLQIWYKKKYENYLFKNRKQLYNLITYINNAKSRGLNNSQIRKELSGFKWSGEQIDYAIKKAEGKRTGMYEIIPVDRVTAMFRKNKSDRAVKQNPGMRVAPPRNVVSLSRQQTGQKVNKRPQLGNRR